MKYKDLPKEEARKICKKQKANCNTCPLRRTSPEGRTLFCYYILMDIIREIEMLELNEEEIQHYNELQEN